MTAAGVTFKACGPIGPKDPLLSFRLTHGDLSDDLGPE